MPVKPLAGIRVCDFTWVGAGPFGTKVLADYGAEVIKIETATRLDVLRHMPPYRDGIPGVNRSGYFAWRNTNKLSLTVNLSTEEGRDIVRRLIAVSDVVANNFTPGTMEKWGLGYEDCRRLRPDIIYLSMPMNGAGGPRAHFHGFGAAMGALTGFMAMTAYPGGEPLGTGTNYPDHTPNPYHAAFAILAALRHRRRTGEGQFIELAQTEATISCLGPLVMEATINGRDPVPMGNRAPDMAPHGVFPCVGPDRWIAIACRTDDEWGRLCRLAQRGWEKEPRWQTLAGRMEDVEALEEAVAEWTRNHDAYVLTRRLQQAGIPASVVQDARDLVLRDAQLRHRGHWLIMDHEEMGPTLYQQYGARLTKTPAQFERPAPMLGEHTAYVLRTVLGMSEAEIHRLAVSDVLR